MNKSAGPTSRDALLARAERAERAAAAIALERAPSCSWRDLQQCKEKVKKLEIELLESRRKKIS